jgi:hypothetical protein
MEFLRWLNQHWFTLLQSIGIVGGLIFTGISFLTDAKDRKVTNLIAVTHEHRDIWTQLYKRPELWRVLNRFPDLTKLPVTAEEQLFVNFVILHLSSVYEAMKNSMFFEAPGLGRDLKHLFSLPIPRFVWEKMKPLQDPKFIEFVERLAGLKNR